VARYGPGDLAAELGPDWEPVAQDREEHTTPAGQAQPFTWVALRPHPLTPCAADPPGSCWCR